MKVDFDFSPVEKELIGDVRSFLRLETTPELMEESLKTGFCYGGPLGRKFIKSFAANGWLTPNWPQEYGGLGASAMVTFAIREEMSYARVPIIFVAAHMAGPTIIHYGSEEMKKEWLFPIARGEIEFSLGYTEPQAGSDLSALQIQAVDNRDHFLINGQKLFNTHSHLADYHWLAVRTDPGANRYQGVSMMIVDLKSPGITIRPILTMAGWQTNEVFYDDVAVPKKNLVGELNKGFYYLMSALDYERMFPLGAYRRLFDEIVDYARETMVNGQLLAKNPLMRAKLVRLQIEIEANRLLYYRLAHILDKGEIPNYQTAMQKVFATELAQKITKTGMEVLGSFSLLKQGSRRAKLDGMAELFHRWSVVETIYAGTSEIQRSIIARRGLNLPGR